MVVDAGEVEARRAAADRDALVAQVAHAEPRDLGDPRIGAGVVLVVAGHREHAVLRAQLAERRDIVAQIVDRAVDQVAGQRDQIRRQRVGVRDHALDERAIDRHADVQVRELHDREAIERASAASRA